MSRRLVDWGQRPRVPGDRARRPEAGSRGLSADLRAVRVAGDVRADSMTGRKRTEEAAASYVFERVDGRRLVLKDVPGAPPGTCDFEIQADPVGVLEVTMLADETVERFMAAIDDYGVIDDTGLRSTWIVSLTKGAVQDLRVKELRKGLLPVLDAL